MRTARFFPSASPAVALVVTLMMMSVLVMMVVGLAGVMRNEQAAARNLSFQLLAEQMAEVGARQGMTALIDNSPVNGNFWAATGPGWIYRGDRGLVRLFSTNPTGFNVNLERIGTNSLILSRRDTEQATDQTLLAGWITVPSASGDVNLPVGRYAWWVDDEGTKANLNAAAAGNTNYFFPMASAWPLDSAQIFKDQSFQRDGAFVSAFNQRVSPFFTPESIKDFTVNGPFSANPPSTNTVPPRLLYRRNKGHITTWATSPPLNPWGEPRFSLAELTTNSAWVTNNGKFGELMGKTFANTNLRAAFGRDFVDKYGAGNRAVGSNVIRQALINAFEAFQPTSSTALPISGATGTNVPTNFLGLNPRGVLCNEVGVGASVNINSTDNTLQIQVWVVPELITAGRQDLLFENTQTIFTVPNNGIRVVSARAGGQSISGFGNFYSTTTVTNLPPRRIGLTITNSGFFTNRTWACFEYTWGPGRGSGPPNFLNNAGRTTDLVLSVEIPEIILLQRSGAGLAVADWYRSGGTLTLTYPGEISSANERVPNPSFAASQQPTIEIRSGTRFKGTAKTDPRSRAFSGWSNIIQWTNTLWIQQNSTLGQLNQGFPNTGISLPDGLTVDRLKSGFTFSNDAKAWLPNTAWFSTNTNGRSAWNTIGTNFPSVVTLGNLHTGLPWRTLRLSAQEGDPNPPDWFLAELFTAATNPVLGAPRLNLNTRILSSGTQTNRLPMVVGLLSVLTNSAGRLSTNFVPDFVSRWDQTRLDTVAVNFTSGAIRWAGGSGSGWSSFRSSTLNVTNNNTNESLFIFGSEIAEVDGIGNEGDSDEARETVLAAALDLVSARSDTFSVWSVGQGLQVLTNATGQPRATNVMGEVRRQTVFQRVTNNNGRNEVRVLYTRTHMVE